VAGTGELVQTHRENSVRRTPITTVRALPAFRDWKAGDKLSVDFVYAVRGCHPPSLTTMRVLCVLQFFPPDGAEGSARLHDFVRALVAHGHDVTVLTSTLSYQTGQPFARFRRKLLVRENDSSGSKVIRLWSPPGYHKSTVTRGIGLLVFMAVALIFSLTLRRPDVVVASSPPPTVGVVAALVARIWCVPFLYEIRDLWVDDAAALGLVRNRALLIVARRVERWVERSAATVVAVTPGIGARLKRRVLFPDRVHVVPNGVDTELFNPTVHPMLLVSRLNVANEFVVVCAGAVGFNNDPHTLIDAAATLRNHRHIVLLVVGDGNARAAAEQRAQQLGLTNLRFTGWIPRWQVPGLICAADAAVCIAVDNPLSHVAYANRAFEAMACGKPVLCLIDGSLREVIAGAGAGLFVPPGNGAALAATILVLAAMPKADRTAMGQRGRDLVENQFERRHMTGRLMALLHATVSGPVQDERTRPTAPDVTGH